MDASIYGGRAADEEMLEVKGLGVFSMRTIYDALVQRDTLATATGMALVRSGEENPAEDSDCSWTHDEDTGDFYIEIRRQLDGFVLSPDQSTMTTNALSRHQRRFVHATAQVMGLGHASLGAQSKYRRMIIFKSHAVTPALPVATISRSETAYIPLEEAWCHELDSPLYTGPLKRQRLQKLDGGFPCQYVNCGKLFDRASERRKHEQSHQPAYLNRFQCLKCEKGFRYPKDLRRHQKVHDTLGNLADVNLLSTSLGTTSSTQYTQPTSMLSDGSRVPSETSLTFNSTHVSHNNSPSLVPWTGSDGTYNDMEVFVLDDAAWTHSLDCESNELNMPFGDLVNFGFSEGDDGEDGLLEMARKRK